MKETVHGSSRRLLGSLGPLCIQPAHDSPCWTSTLSYANSRKVIKRPRHHHHHGSQVHRPPAAAATDRPWLALAKHPGQYAAVADGDRPDANPCMSPPTGSAVETFASSRPIVTKYFSVWPRVGQSEYDVFVGNLENSISASTLASWFEPFANVLHARIITDHTSGQSRGFGFVTFGSEPSMTKAIRAMNGTEQAGKIIRVEQSSPKAIECPF